MPDGTLIQGVPDGTTQSALMARYSKYTPPKGLIQTVGDQISARQNQVNTEPDTDNPLTQMARTAGSGIGLMGDVAGDVSSEIGKGAYAIAHPVLPTLTDTVAAIPKTVGNLVNPIVQPIEKYAGEKYNQALPQGTQVRTAVDSLGDAVGGLAKTLPVASGIEAIAGAIPKIGDALVKSGTDAALANRNNFISNLVSEPADKGVRAENALNNTDVKGLTQKAVVQPTKEQIDATNHISNIPEVGPQNTIQKNLNFINDHVSEEADSLKSQLVSKNVIAPPNEIHNAITQSANDLAQNPYISNAKGTGILPSAQKVVDQMRLNVNSNPPTLDGLLQARKDFDKQALKWKGEGVFADGKDTAIKATVRAMRNTVNGYIDQKAAQSGLDVSESLQKQSSLLNAMDNIAPKAAAEAPTMAGRAADKLKNSLAVTNSIRDVAGPFIGATAGIIPDIGLITAKGGINAIKSPMTRKVIGKMIGGK